jgi:hypothetical protein
MIEKAQFAWKNDAGPTVARTAVAGPPLNGYAKLHQRARQGDCEGTWRRPSVAEFAGYDHPAADLDCVCADHPALACHDAAGGKIALARGLLICAPTLRLRLSQKNIWPRSCIACSGKLA